MDKNEKEMCIYSSLYPSHNAQIPGGNTALKAEPKDKFGYQS